MMSARSDEGMSLLSTHGISGTASMITTATPAISSMKPSSAPDRHARPSFSMNEKTCGAHARARGKAAGGRKETRA